MVLLSLLVFNQLEGVLVSPFAIGRAVRLHPAAACSLSVTAGASIVGIAGAFLSPSRSLAVTLTFIRVLYPVRELFEGEPDLAPGTAPA